jgi:hypothetical protein
MFASVFSVFIVLIRVNLYLFLMYRSQDISVSIAMTYRLDGMGSIPVSGRLFSSPQRPIQCVLRVMRQGREAHLHLVPRSREVEPYLQPPCLHGTVFN